MALAARGRDGLRCGDSGAVLEKAAVEVRGVALSNGVIPIENCMVTVSDAWTLLADTVGIAVALLGHAHHTERSLR
jgi:hypothetical protein